ENQQPQQQHQIQNQQIQNQQNQNQQNQQHQNQDQQDQQQNPDYFFDFVEYVFKPSILMGLEKPDPSLFVIEDEEEDEDEGNNSNNSNNSNKIEGDKKNENQNVIKKLNKAELKKIRQDKIIKANDELKSFAINSSNVNNLKKKVQFGRVYLVENVGSEIKVMKDLNNDQFIPEHIMIKMDNEIIERNIKYRARSRSGKKDKVETLGAMNNEGTKPVDSGSAECNPVGNLKLKPVEELKLKPAVELYPKISNEKEVEIIIESSKDFLRKEKACIKKTATDWWENNEIDSPLTLDDLTKIKRWGKSNDRNLDWREISLVQTQEVLVEEELLPKKPIQKLNNYLDFGKKLDIPLCIKPTKWVPILETIYEEVEEPQNENYNSENTSINLEDRIKESFINLFKGKNPDIFDKKKCQLYYEKFFNLSKNIVADLEGQEEEDLSSCYNETEKEDENYLTDDEESVEDYESSFEEDEHSLLSEEEDENYMADDEKSVEDYESNFEADESLLLSEEEYSDSERETFLFQPIENDIIKGIVMKCLDDEMNLADEMFENKNHSEEEIELFIKLENEHVSLDESSSSDEDELAICCELEDWNVSFEEGDEEYENDFIKSADSLQVRSVVYKPGDEIIRKIIHDELLENMEDLMNFKTPVNFGK
ncbi:uncharacterized protein KGF55_000098, partial [Candida pseudojiufengensis]|uniref:uncharacterized protein n=1 Tax=Candida pseudojiufengensis TaxID=497109 RepID=UPI0022246F9E